MGKAITCVIVLLAGICIFKPCLASEAQETLITELFNNYQPWEKPPLSEDGVTTTKPIIIQFGLTLNILVFVDDMNQIMKTNGYMEIAWNDTRLRWDPAKHGGVTCLRLPVEKVWQPDVALTNTCNGKYEPNYKSNVLVYNSGYIFWVPPFIFISGCDTNPLYFPFDRQLCNMVFRSTTYSADEVDFFLDHDSSMVLKDYSEQPSGTWDILEPVPMTKYYRMNYRTHGPVPDVSVQIDLTVARKSLFYVITFLLPCVCIAFLTVFLFYLPTASGEKLCLAISILFSIVVFLLILLEILPPSDCFPLMMKFLVFTFVCNLVSVVITTICVNWNFRNPKTHTMPNWVRVVFLHTLPNYIGMKRPQRQDKKKLFQPAVPQSPLTAQKSSLKFRGSNGSKQASVRFALDDGFEEGTGKAELIKPASPAKYPSYGVITASNNYGFTESRDSTNSASIKELLQLGQYLAKFPGYEEALANVAYIAKNMEEQDEEGDVADDWKFVTLVIDRFLLIIFFIGNTIGSFSILLNSPNLYLSLPSPAKPAKSGDPFVCLASDAQATLIDELFLTRNYDLLSRPVDDIRETVNISFGLTLNILVSVCDKDQVMKTNGYMELSWNDNRLKWDPAAYGGVKVLRLPVDKIWQPDVALTNTVDGQFWPSYKSNALVYHDGLVMWVPPFIFKSGCATDPLYFPFDRQLCYMVFRSVTYNAHEVDLRLTRPKMELKDYLEQPSGSWDVAEVPMSTRYRMNYHTDSPSPDVSVELNIWVARKAQFYIVTFLLPCVCIGFVTVVLFCLPTASGEKLCLAISILFAIVVFLLILSEILPPSDSVPLMTKFLVFTFLCNLASVTITTVSVNWHFRSPKTHAMPRWVRLVFLELLPGYIGMRPPSDHYSDEQPNQERPALWLNSPEDNKTLKSCLKKRELNRKQAGTPPRLAFSSCLDQDDDHAKSENWTHLYNFMVPDQGLIQLGQYLQQFPGYEDAVTDVAFIADATRAQHQDSQVTDDWKYIVMVVDRLLLIVFLIGVKAALKAYSYHHRLIIRPENVWITILRQLSLYVNANAEQLRHVFAAPEGQNSLAIDVLMYETQCNTDFEIAEAFGAAIQGYLLDKTLRDWIISDFTTTTVTDRIVSSVTVMATFEVCVDRRLHEVNVC
ncbi:Acetylcholine receptor subunit beta-like 1 [Hypsibius exemplaris]|uniref:Acetylcholine receptor subunit beta-like 1 n=1 Tax=Hypsibius exemplaris TaxID=2072580 RepID=A0A1W0WX64_HYPEX|nr:Acetylcholine receptor subunit beta-like 1 [Hypsibius exemplaris]